MKRLKKLLSGGIQNKIFNLILATVILMTVAFSAVAAYRNNMLSKLASASSERQKESISDISNNVMTGVIDRSLSQTTQMEALLADHMFLDLKTRVEMIGEYAGKVFEDPARMQRFASELPDPDKEGEVTAQLILADGVNRNDARLNDRIGLAGNLIDMMTSLYGVSDDTNSCFVALPEGVLLVVDDRSASKVNEDGSVVSYDPTTREWYQQAVEAGHTIFSDVEIDAFTGDIGIVCATPVYANGQLTAVVGSDLFLASMQEQVSRSGENGSFSFIINRKGHVVFSPDEEGIFRVRASDEAEDLRRSSNTQLAGFIMDAMRVQTSVKLINLEDGAYYMVGSPMRTVGWTLVSARSQETVTRPAAMMTESLNEIQNGTTQEYRDMNGHTQFTATLLMLAIAAAMVGLSLSIAKRIVEPLKTMTTRLTHLSAKNLEFKMDDAFRTGDEVEELAKSISDLSHKTVEYMETISQVTAEKERIGVEMSLAKNIQESMLPHAFPAFPDRHDFDVYANMDPAKEVGGDFYDFFLIDDDHLCIMIADVSGKGVPAALFMMASKIVLQSVAMLGHSPAQILAKTNEALCSNNTAEMFVTVWLGIVELSTGRLTAANAGHEYPVFKHPHGAYELYKDKHGFVVGGMEDAQYQEYEVQLEPGSRIFVYTDGLPEATDKKQEMFGTDRILNVLNEVPDAGPNQVLEHMSTAVDFFVQDAEQFDDLTMLCMEYKGPDTATAPAAAEVAEDRNE